MHLHGAAYVCKEAVCEALDRQMVKVQSNLEPAAQKRPICTFSKLENLADWDLRTAETYRSKTVSPFSKRKSSAICMFPFLLFSLALCSFAYWSLAESWKLLCLKNQYPLGKDLASLVFALQAWWKNAEKISEGGAEGCKDLQKLILTRGACLY